MKKCVNGQYTDMSPEEIAELQAARQEQPAAPTTEERLAALEAAMLAMMGGGADV